MKKFNIHYLYIYTLLSILSFKLIWTKEAELETPKVEENITIKETPESKEIEKELDIEKKLKDGYLKEEEKEIIKIEPENITEKKISEEEIIKENKENENDENKNISDFIEKFEDIDDTDELLDDIEKEFSLEDIR